MFFFPSCCIFGPVRLTVWKIRYAFAVGRGENDSPLGQRLAQKSKVKAGRWAERQSLPALPERSPRLPKHWHTMPSGTGMPKPGGGHQISLKKKSVPSAAISVLHKHKKDGQTFGNTWSLGVAVEITPSRSRSMLTRGSSSGPVWNKEALVFCSSEPLTWTVEARRPSTNQQMHKSMCLPRLQQSRG